MTSGRAITVSSITGEAIWSLEFNDDVDCDAEVRQLLHNFEHPGLIETIGATR